MSNFFRYTALLSLFLLISVLGMAKNASIAQGDSLADGERMPNAAFFEELRDDKAFDYGPLTMADNEVIKFTFLEKIKDFLKMFSGLFTALPVLIRIAFWGFLVFLLYMFITKTRIYRVFYSDKQIVSGVTEPEEEEEYVEDFDTAINVEVANGQYRKAVRYQFLKILDGLSRAEMIKFSKEKTNRQYMLELKDSTIQSQFIELTTSYNYIWYGGHNISKEQYMNIANGFERFNLRLDEAA